MGALWLDHQQCQPTGVVGTDVATKGGAGKGHGRGNGEGCCRDKAWPRQVTSTAVEELQSAAAKEAQQKPCPPAWAGWTSPQCRRWGGAWPILGGLHIQMDSVQIFFFILLDSFYIVFEEQAIQLLLILNLQVM